MDQPMMWLAESRGVRNVMPGGLEMPARKEHLLHNFGTSLSIIAYLQALLCAKGWGWGQGWWLYSSGGDGSPCLHLSRRSLSKSVQLKVGNLAKKSRAGGRRLDSGGAGVRQQWWKQELVVTEEQVAGSTEPAGTGDLSAGELPGNDSFTFMCWP